MIAQANVIEGDTRVTLCPSLAHHHEVLSGDESQDRHVGICD